MRSHRTDIIERLKTELKKRPTPASDVISLLQAEFKKNPSTESKCIESARTYIDRNIPNRLFNNFPCLISPKKLRQLSQQFITIINKIQETDINDDLAITDQAILQQLTTWEKKIITFGTSQLLDKTGQVHESLFVTLRLESYRHKIQACDVVSSFVALIHECITEHAKNTLKKRPMILPACHTYLNERRLGWITEQLDKTDYVFVSSREAKKQTSTLGSNALPLFGAMAIGAASMYMLFNRKTIESETVTVKESKPIATRVNF